MLSRVAIGPRWGSAKPSSMVLLLSSTTYGVRRCGAGAAAAAGRAGGGGARGGGGSGGGRGGAVGAGERKAGRCPPVPAPRTSSAHTACPSADRHGSRRRARR